MKLKYIKLFEELSHEDIDPYGEEIWETPISETLVKELDRFTFPEEPMKRKLTEVEIDKLSRYYWKHSWSNVDALGRIILGGGMSKAGRYYITPEDLETLE